MSTTASGGIPANPTTTKENGMNDDDTKRKRIEALKWLLQARRDEDEVSGDEQWENYDRYDDAFAALHDALSDDDLMLIRRASHELAREAVARYDGGYQMAQRTFAQMEAHGLLSDEQRKAWQEGLAQMDRQATELAQLFLSIPDDEEEDESS